MTVDPLPAFAWNVRARRWALGLTQEAAADRASMNTSYWSRIERGKIDPGSRMVTRVAIALATTPAQLFGEVAAPPPFEEEIVITVTRGSGGKIAVEAVAAR